MCTTESRLHTATHKIYVQEQMKGKKQSIFQVHGHTRE